MFLTSDTFATVIDATPLVSIDLLVRNAQGQVLLGYRDNKPAQHTWFVPGGRVRKSETIAEAFARLVSVELGLVWPLDEAEFVGPYEHMYLDNALNREGLTTHYVVLAYTFTVPAEQPLNLKDQHAKSAWWSVAELLASENVHVNTKAYFDARYVDLNERS
jgi:colanic acid biosynthesis protein WcaH